MSHPYRGRSQPLPQRRGYCSPGCVWRNLADSMTEGDQVPGPSRSEAGRNAVYDAFGLRDAPDVQVHVCASEVPNEGQLSAHRRDDWFSDDEAGQIPAAYTSDVPGEGLGHDVVGVDTRRQADLAVLR